MLRLSTISSGAIWASEKLGTHSIACQHILGTWSPSSFLEIHTYPITLRMRLLFLLNGSLSGTSSRSPYSTHLAASRWQRVRVDPHVVFFRVASNPSLVRTPVGAAQFT